MPAIVTQSFKQRQVTEFLAYAKDEDTNVFMFIGNPYEWGPGGAPIPVDNDQFEIDLWDRMYGMRRILNSGISRVIRRRNWISGVVFEIYKQDLDKPVYETNSYCMNSQFQIYKCIWNNDGAASTVEPFGEGGSDNLEGPLADGYIWSYMYTIETNDAQNFITPAYLPIKNEPDVQNKAAATIGKVMAVEIVDPPEGSVSPIGGSGFLSVNFVGGNPTRHASAYTIVNPNTSIHSIVIVDGGEGYQSTPSIEISGVGNGAAFGSPNVEGGKITNEIMTPSIPGSGYVPIVIEELSGTGTGFSAVGVAKGGSLTKIIVLNRGEGYNHISLRANGGNDDAYIKPILTPPNGHGADAEMELGGTSIMFSTVLDPNEILDILPPGNYYRNIGIIFDPLANELPVDMGLMNITGMTKLEMTPTDLPYVMNDVVEVTATGAKAKVIFWNSSNNTLYVIRTLNENYIPFNEGDVILGVGGKEATIRSAEGEYPGGITLPTLDKYTGDIQYIENRTKVLRAFGQLEDIKIVIEF